MDVEFMFLKDLKTVLNTKIGKINKSLLNKSVSFQSDINL